MQRTAPLNSNVCLDSITRCITCSPRRWVGRVCSERGLRATTRGRLRACACVCVCVAECEHTCTTSSLARLAIAEGPMHSPLVSQGEVCGTHAEPPCKTTPERLACGTTCMAHTPQATGGSGVAGQTLAPPPRWPSCEPMPRQPM
jgi:hypothetical protein